MEIAGIGMIVGFNAEGANMYRIPKDLDLSQIVGTFTTQLRVGQFDLQFTLGDPHHQVTFAVQSAVNLFGKENSSPTGKKGSGRILAFLKS